MTDEPLKTEEEPATDTLVFALGHPFAGDDGVGIAVVEILKRYPLPPWVRAVASQNPADLFHLLSGIRTVVVVDAVTAYGREGEILLLPPGPFMETETFSVSSHGLGVLEVLRIAQILKPEEFPQEVMILGIVVRSPQRFSGAISPRIREAIPGAVKKLLQILGLQEVYEKPDPDTIFKAR